MSSISLIQEGQTALKQQQQLLVNLAMKQAFHVLQLPLLELSEWLKSEIESNPILEIDITREPYKENFDAPVRAQHSLRSKAQEDVEKRRKEHQEHSLIASVSLFEYLMGQAPLAFDARQDLHLAELIIGHLNDKGFLDTPLQEIAPAVPLAMMEQILSTIQTFDPPGIAARNLTECLLLQLKFKQKENTLAAKIIEHHFDDLIHNLLPHISKKLHIPISQLVEIVDKEIAPLDLHPGYRFLIQPMTAIIPDLFFLFVDEKWQIEVNTSFLPHFQIAPTYANALSDPSIANEEYFYLRRQLAGGKWLKRIVQRRNQTLHAIGKFILTKQMAFFNGDKGRLVPMSIQEIAQELSVNESTIARAVVNKFVACPHGLFSLKSFFTQGMQADNGQHISKHSLRDILAKTIEKEDKLHPLSDEEIVQHFRKLGLPCARRTIAKYRTHLNIPPASKRRKWNS